MATKSVYKKSWSKKLALSIGRSPFRKSVSETVKVSFELLNVNGQYKVKIGFMGKSFLYALGDICYPVATFGHFLSLEVCTRNLIFGRDGVTPKTLTLTVKTCIGKWGVSRCTNLFNDKISI